MVGLPRSGKSTEAKKYQEEGYVKVSADDFRQLMYGQRFYSEGEGMMWATRDIALKILLQQGVNIVIDETNIDSSTRAKVIKLAEKYDYSVDCVFMDTEANVCVKRAVDTQQEDLIPVIDKLAYRLQEPLIDEGFDSIVTIYSNGYKNFMARKKPLQELEEREDI